MSDEKKTKQELIEELEGLRAHMKRIKQLEKDNAQLRSQLERREKRFQSVIDNINVGLYRNTTGPQGRFIEVNRAQIRMFGYSSREEFLKLKVSDLYLFPEDRKKFSRKLQEQGFVRDEKIVLKKKDGTPIHCSVSAVSVKDNSGKIRFFDGVIEDISERLEAEEALKQSEAKFRQIIESSPMGMHLYELRGKNRLIFIGSNPAADRILKVDNSQFMGKTIEEAFPPLARTEVPERYRATAKNGTPWKTDQVVYEDDKIKGAFEVYAFQTSKDRMAAMFLDMTERKQADEALRDSDERYQSLFNRSLYGVFIHDLEGRFLDANQAALQMLGYKREDITKLKFTDLLDQKQVQKAQRVTKEILETGHQQEPSIYSLKARADEMVWVETEATLLYKNGEAFAIQGIARNITEQKKAEDALRESEEKYRAIYESFQDVYYRTDREGLVILISPSVKNQAGYDPEDVIGHQVTDFYVDPDERQSFTETLKKDGYVNDYELQLLAKDGHVIEVSASSKVILDPDGRPLGVEGVLRDITDRKSAEEKLKTSLREKEVLLQEIHHRVKNNMQIVSSLLNLQSQKVSDKVVKEKFQESRGRIRTMALIHEKLYQSQDLARVNLAEYIESLYLHLFHMYGIDSRKVVLTREIEEIFLDINTAIPLGLVINELLTNAVKHAFPNGSGGEIHLQLSTDDGGMRKLVVKDNGVGMPLDFDIRNPSSLGMQLVLDLVKQIKGSLDIETRDGTTFLISF